jgi:hypothetical protein
MFCLYGRFVPTDVLSHGRYVSGCFDSGRFVSGRFVPTDVLSPDVLSGLRVNYTSILTDNRKFYIFKIRFPIARRANGSLLIVLIGLIHLCVKIDIKVKLKMYSLPLQRFIFRLVSSVFCRYGIQPKFLISVFRISVGICIVFRENPKNVPRNPPIFYEWKSESLCMEEEKAEKEAKVIPPSIISLSLCPPP